jgi:glucokinase
MMRAVSSSGERSGIELIGVDVGGTKVLGVRVRVRDGSSAPEVLDTVELPSVAHGSEVLDVIVAAVQALADGASGAAGVGLGLAGFVDPSGVVRVAPNAAGLVDLDVALTVAERLGLDCVADNDANCVAVACHAALGPRVTDLVAVTLGTGIGGGIVVGGELVRGRRGWAGEPGHVVVDPDGPRCPCGQRGCWERYASGSALSAAIRRAVDSGALDRAEVPTDTASDLLAAASRGVSAAEAVLGDFAAWVALGLAGLVALLDPDVVAVGGGVTAAGDGLLDAVRGQLVLRHGVVVGEDPPELVLAPGGPAAGAIGAAVLAGRRLGLLRVGA